MKNQSDKLRLIAFLLAFFFGMFGVHRFYVGQIGTGVVQLLFTLTFFLSFVTAIWVIIDWIIILAGAFKDKEGKLVLKWVE